MLPFIGYMGDYLLKMQKKVFGDGALLGPTEGACSASPETLAVFKGPLPRERSVRKEQKKGEEREGITPSTNSWIRHCGTRQAILYQRRPCASLARLHLKGRAQLSIEKVSYNFTMSFKFLKP